MDVQSNPMVVVVTSTYGSVTEGNIQAKIGRRSSKTFTTLELP